MAPGRANVAGADFWEPHRTAGVKGRRGPAPRRFPTTRRSRTCASGGTAGRLGQQRLHRGPTPPIESAGIRDRTGVGIFVSDDLADGYPETSGDRNLRNNTGRAVGIWPDHDENDFRPSDTPLRLELPRAQRLGLLQRPVRHVEWRIRELCLPNHHVSEATIVIEVETYEHACPRYSANLRERRARRRAKGLTGWGRHLRLLVTDDIERRHKHDRGVGHERMYVQCSAGLSTRTAPLRRSKRVSPAVPPLSGNLRATRDETLG